MNREGEIQKTLLSMTLFLVCVCSDIAAHPPAQFGPRPRVAHTAESLEAWKNDPARLEEKRSILADADQRIQSPVSVPDAEGQWYFFYLCPHDGTQLTPDSPTQHRCGTCSATFDDERTCSAYRGIQWGEVDQAIHRLALAYALSDDDRYAVEARRLFLAMADVYPRLKRHDRWGYWGEEAPAGGRRYAQRLDESTSGIQLAKAYDLMANAPCMTGADRTVIETHYFRQLATDLQADATRAMWEIENPKDEIWQTAERDVSISVLGRVGFHPDRSEFSPPSDLSVHRSNHQSWQNACLAMIGLTLGDDELLELAVYGRVGLQWQLDNSVTEEGLWYEVCMNYQFYAMSAIVETVQAADRVGWSFRDNVGLRSLWEGPVRFSYPDGRFPVINDSDVDRIQNRGGTYQWASDYFGEPTFAAMADPSPAARAGLGATTSTNMSDAGLVYLRNGDEDAPVCVVLDYGPHGGQHGHPDKLNVTVFANGEELVADTGRIGYSFREYHAWARTTAANNTVVINGQDQKPAEGRIASFTATSNGGTVSAVCDTAYPGYVMTRTLTLEGTRLTDEVTVVGQEPAAIDLFTHIRGLDLGVAMSVPHSSESGEGATEETLPGDGYAELKNVSRWRDDLRVVRLSGGLGSILFDDSPTSVNFSGTAVGTTLTEHIPFILRRIEGTQALFKTTYNFAALRICFVCTGNYYRSRFAEEYFNQKASEQGFACRAESRGVHIEVPEPWPSGMSPVAVEQLLRYGITPTTTNRWPLALSSNDLDQFDLFVALNEREHVEGMKKAGVPENRMLIWNIEDVSGGPAEQQIPRLVTNLNHLLPATSRPGR